VADGLSPAEAERLRALGAAIRTIGSAPRGDNGQAGDE
jgi:hypothetical protein